MAYWKYLNTSLPRVGYIVQSSAPVLLRNALAYYTVALRQVCCWSFMCACFLVLSHYWRVVNSKAPLASRLTTIINSHHVCVLGGGGGAVVWGMNTFEKVKLCMSFSLILMLLHVLTLNMDEKWALKSPLFLSVHGSCTCILGWGVSLTCLQRELIISVLTSAFLVYWLIDPFTDWLICCFCWQHCLLGIFI